MIRLVAQRLVESLVVLLIMSFAVYGLMYLMPGDPLDLALASDPRARPEDIEELKGCGYSEDAIFEITLCAAVGASMARLERGLEILTHDSPSPAEE